MATKMRSPLRSKLESFWELLPTLASVAMSCIPSRVHTEQFKTDLLCGHHLRGDGSWVRMCQFIHISIMLQFFFINKPTLCPDQNGWHLECWVSLLPKYVFSLFSLFFFISKFFFHFLFPCKPQLSHPASLPPWFPIPSYRPVICLLS